MLMEDESNAPKMILISYIICKDRILMTLLPYTEIFGKKKGVVTDWDLIQRYQIINNKI